MEVITRAGGRAEAVAFDITDAKAVTAGVARLNGPVDILVNNAGIPEGMRTVADVTNSVLGAHLRSWALGRSPIRQAYSAVESAVDLIFEGLSIRRAKGAADR